MFPFVGALGIEPRRCAKHAWVTATPGATPVCAPENEKSHRGFPRVAPDRFGYFSLVYESGAFPSYVLGCGWPLIPTTVPWPAKFAMPCQSRRAHACPMTPWRLVTLVVADAVDMIFSTKRTLARRRAEVNVARDRRDLLHANQGGIDSFRE